MTNISDHERRSFKGMEGKPGAYSEKVLGPQKLYIPKSASQYSWVYKCSDCQIRPFHLLFFLEQALYGDPAASSGETVPELQHHQSPSSSLEKLPHIGPPLKTKTEECLQKVPVRRLRTEESMIVDL